MGTGCVHFAGGAGGGARWRYRGWIWCVRMRERRAWSAERISEVLSALSLLQQRAHQPTRSSSSAPKQSLSLSALSCPTLPWPSSLVSSIVCQQKQHRAESLGLGWWNAGLWFARDKRSGVTRVGVRASVAPWHDSVRDYYY